MNQFTKLEISKENLSAALLFLGVFFALFISNNKELYIYYKNFVDCKLQITLGPYSFEKTILKLVNDGLMAIFFFFLGLEMKYHMTEGEFKDKKTLILPTLTAIGGFIIPALLYVAFNINTPETMSGWAIPVATDTAFVLAILSLFGKKISNSTKVFVIGISIIDDVLAVVVLAIFYTPNLDLTQLLFCLFPLLFLTTLNIKKSYNRYSYYIGGLILWFFTVKSGVHGTIAGIILAFFVPTKIELFDKTVNFIKEIESSIHSLVAFFVLPVFAFVNCELPLHELTLEEMFSSISLGCFAGLFIGKPLGIYGAYLFGITMYNIERPQGCSELQFFAISFLCGIGFTLSLFIGLLALDPTALENEVKIGVLTASLGAALTGALLLKFSNPGKLD